MNNQADCMKIAVCLLFVFLSKGKKV